MRPFAEPIVDHARGQDNSVELGRRQTVLLDVARQANGSGDPWTLAEQAIHSAADALGMSFHALGRCTSRSSDELLLRLGQTSGDSDILNVPCSTAADRSVVGYSLHVGGPVFTPDLDEELRFSDPMITRRSIRSALVCPLIHESEQFGVIGALGRQPREFDVEDVCFLEMIARMLATALSRAALERQLIEQKRLTEKMLETTDAMVVKLSPQLRIQSVNPAFSQSSGFDNDEVADRSLSSAMLDDDELHLVKQAIDRVRHGEEGVRFESGLVTKSGEQRRVAWSYTALTGEDGAIDSLLGTGIDITEHCEVLARLEQVERVSQSATQRMNSLQQELDRRRAAESEADGTAKPGTTAARELERRRHLRVPFPRMQEIGPIINGKIPDRDRFLTVRCHDISGGGFSFFLPTAPEFEELVIALGEGDRCKYLTARVRQVRPVEFDGRRMKLIGCAYSGRLELISNGEHGDYFVMTGKV